MWSSPMLLTGWQHHIDSITKALLAKYVMKKSGSLPEGNSLWRYLWTTKDHAMCTLPSPKAARKIQKDECAEANPSSAQDGPLPCPSPLTVQTYCDASFAPGGGRSRSGILVLLVDQKTNRASLLLWQSRRQTLTALSAPEAEVVALSEALMPAVVIHESCRDKGLEAGLSPQVLFVVKTDSQVTLTQLRTM